MSNVKKNMDHDLSRFNSDLYGAICRVLETARQNAYKAVNFAMVQAYWQIGRLIVEDEQNGEARAEYGKKVPGRAGPAAARGFWQGVRCK